MVTAGSWAETVAVGDGVGGVGLGVSVAVGSGRVGVAGGDDVDEGADTGVDWGRGWGDCSLLQAGAAVNSRQIASKKIQRRFVIHIPRKT